LFLFLSLLLSGCASLSPYGKEWNGVRVTDNKNDVSACKYIDVFHSWPPYIRPNDDIRNVTRRAAEVGADTVLVTGARLVVTEGRAYKCHKS
ncbi:MAG: hypothetical protein ACREU3_10725, partial [Steroidobacteraceae bacterium]